MDIQSLPTEPSVPPAMRNPEIPAELQRAATGSPEVKEAFQDFVGQTFYSQMLSAMRKTVEKPAYFHGGRAEEIFQGQLDQVLSESLSEATADSFSGPLYELFSLRRGSAGQQRQDARKQTRSGTSCRYADLMFRAGTTGCNLEPAFSLPRGARRQFDGPVEAT